MGKVFRIHSSGEEKTGWFQSSPIGAKELETIKAGKDDVATSIPSPFARIDLVKTAFGWVRNHELTGQSGYHKLVSDALDVAQLFYLSQNAQYKDNIAIVEWSKEFVFEKYKHEKASSFYSSFEVFWKQDGVNYNLDSTERLYFIYYKNNLVGATSPSTLFVSAPDASASFLEMDITRGTDKLFDDKYAALHEREFPFIKYIFSLSKTREFQEFFRETGKNEFHEYLEKVREELPSSKRAEINLLNSNSITNYPICTTSNSTANEVSILGIRLGTEVLSTIIDSDFFINSKKGKRALVLPQTKFNRAWKYTSADDIWNPEEMVDKVPRKNPDPHKSILPENGSQILWYSIDDFLADNIFTFEASDIGEPLSTYPLNHNDFNVGILEDGISCLIPLKAKFFEYFDHKDIPDLCQVTKNGVLLTVKLKIPTSTSGFIEFEKSFRLADQVQINICLALMSLIKTGESNSNYLGFQYNVKDKLNYTLTPRMNTGEACPFIKQIRDFGEQSEWKAEIIKTQDEFDFIEIGVNGEINYLIPNWKSVALGNDGIEFAIDFGTTNTHIEYKVQGQGALKEFDYKNSSGYLTYLIDIQKWDDIPESDVKQFYPQFEKYLFPLSIGSEEESHFPMRSVLAYNEHINFNATSNSLLDGNSYHFYERRLKADNQKIKTDLKWSNYDDHKDQLLVELFVESLLNLVRIKAINEGCSTKNVVIKWFYPVSMNSHEIDMLTEIWQQYFRSVFPESNEENLIRIPESVAPYLYYRNQYPGTSMTIDIGGGSTDIALFDNDSIKASYITSFKFAGNSIFGDGYTAPQRILNTDKNGFVNMFSKRVENLLSDEKHSDKAILEDRLKNVTKNSADYVSFLFSLEEDKTLNFGFGKELRRDSKINLSFLVFYSSIFYYSAQLQKLLNKPTPKNFIFSGTASKSMLFLDNSQGSDKIKALIKHFYGKILNEDINEKKINIVRDAQPKQVTARGGLKLNLNDDISKNEMKFWLGGSGALNRVVDKNNDVKTTPRYNEISSVEESEIIASIKDLYQMLDSFFEGRRLSDQFNIDDSAIQIFKSIREEDLNDFVNWGVESYYGNHAHHIEESLFFFPLVGVLNRLSYQLSVEKEL